ncbi:uncharacterized protein F5891DRAFT_984216 [Suillus fuscotomentosus]|uniref:Uncharacterized protein n=1 Tax=Suillus fuscotomentosus TaxID=1912939 RepID=A0AAD4DWL0_9AGAM|nr:uncharacterized protein F5891DRAFT_984216 [Suillus fuscotomentosus]KAG1895420.1 hypothetical protein F5891DRAFT_984216 [Suillus fuscotomentosus]
MSAQVQSAGINIAVQQLPLAVQVVSFTLVVYDHAMTFAQEFMVTVKNTVRQIRYLALAQVCLNAVTTMGVAKVHYDLGLTVMILCQCVITLRVWHLFPRSRFIRWLAVTIFTACLAGGAIFDAIKYNAIKSAAHTNNDSISAQCRRTFSFILYLPALVVHTTMFLLTLYRFRVTPRTLQQHGMIHRFVKEGMILYSFAAGEYTSILFVLQMLKQITGSLLYEIISLSLIKPEDISNFGLGDMGEIAMAATAVSICRAMLSIRCLAATYHVDPAWLLNHAELSRVQWRRGHNEGEIYVEVSEMDVVLPFKSAVLPVGNIGREDEVQNHT